MLGILPKDWVRQPPRFIYLPAKRTNNPRARITGTSAVPSLSYDSNAQSMYLRIWAYDALYGFAPLGAFR